MSFAVKGGDDQLKSLQLEEIIDIVGEMFADEVSIVVANTKEYIYYRPSKRIDLKISPGDPIRKGTIAHRILFEKQRVSSFVDRDVFGVPYHGMAIPYERNGELLGCIMAIYPSYTEGKSIITVKTQDGWKPVPFKDVKYIEVKDRKTYVFTDGLVGTHKNSLQHFEFILPTELFIRCHRSFIVNVEHIEEIHPDTYSTFVLAMNDGAKIPVSQSYSSYFRKLLGF